MSTVRWVVLIASAVSLFACGSPADPEDAGESDGGGTCTADEQCDDGTYCNGTERCDPGASGGDTQGCVSGSDPCSGSVCVEADQRCDCSEPDADGDGAASLACGGDDCDDANAMRYPGNVEVCDGEVDEDCDVSTLGDDGDGDGHVSTMCCNRLGDGSLSCGDDCDDTLSGVHPGIVKSCNLEDDDCDAMTDEGVTTVCAADGDNDGFAPTGATTREQCASCTETDNWASEPRFPSEIDCDDTDETVNPGAPELCDGIDSDCSDGGASPAPDEDADEDGYASVVSSCSGGAIPKLDCNDRDNRVRPNQTQRYDEPHCTGGAPEACLLNTGEWSCAYPRSRDMDCDTGSFISGSSAPSWDFNCNATLEPEDAHSGSCDCTVNRCGEEPTGGGLVAAGPAIGPRFEPEPSDCGQLVVAHQCVVDGSVGGACGGLGDGTCNYSSSTTPIYRVRCR